MIASTSDRSAVRAAPERRAEASQPNPQPVMLLRGPKVYGPHGRTGMSRSAWYGAMREGSAPKSVSLGVRMVAWRSTDIDAFIASRVTAAGNLVAPKGA